MSNHLYYIVASFTIFIRPFVLKDLLLPTSKNGYHPIVLRKGSIAIFALILFIFNTTVGSLPLSRAYAAIEISKVVELHNKERQKAGLSTLVVNSKLSASATEKAKAMLASDCWSHYCPNGKSPWDFFVGEDYDYVYAGENLAEGFNDNAVVMQAWMNSPTHKANVLKPEFQEIGIGTASGSFQGNPNNVIVVVHFGTQISTFTNLPTTSNVPNNNVQTSAEVPLAAPIIDEPVSGSSTNDTYFTIKGRTEKDSTVTVIDNDQIKGSVDDEGGIFTFKPQQGSPYLEGSHILSAYYTESQRISGRSAESTVIVDTIAPVVSSDTLEIITTDSENLFRIRLLADANVAEVYLNVNEEKVSFITIPDSNYWEGEIDISNLDDTDVVKITAIDKAENITSTIINTGEVLSAISQVTAEENLPLGVIQKVVSREVPTLKNTVSVASLLIIGLLFLTDTIILAKTTLPEGVIKGKYHFHLSSFLILLFSVLLGGIGGNVLEGITQ